MTVVSSLFPWAPSVISTDFKLNVFMCESSPLFSLANAYYSRFGLEILPWRFLSKHHLQVFAVIDEGGKFPPSLLQKLSCTPDSTTYVRIGESVSKGLKLIDQISGAHSEFGGVSDAVSKIFFRSTMKSFPNSSITFPTRDLRYVLKSGVDGKPCRAPPHRPPLEAQASVKFLRPSEILNAGLFPWKSMSRPLRVRTLFGSKFWVSRLIEDEEKCAIADIPEPLVLLLNRNENSDGMTRHLLLSCRVPLKSLSFLLKRVLTGTSEIKPVVSVAPPRRTESVVETEKETLENLHTKPSVELVSNSNRGPVENIQASLKIIILDSASENRSKTSDYDEALEPLWDIRVLDHCRVVDESGRPLDWRKSFSLMRSFLFRSWRLKVLRSWMSFKKSLPEGTLNAKDKIAAADCMKRCADCSSWSWSGGSRPFFWRWDPEWRAAQRDGFKQWLRPESENLKWFRRQPNVTPERKLLISKKLEDVRYKGYISPGPVKSMMSYFDVPKGTSDIRMVYDGTKSGLNSVMWAPWFPLPTASSLLRMVEQGTWMGDNDAGECFINWLLHEDVQRLCGIDISQFSSPDELTKRFNTPVGKLLLEVWTRCAMGLKSSPYIAIKCILLIKEKILGDPANLSNVFRWEKVLLNLPGMESYDSSKPWVSKRRSDGVLAADCLPFVDDYRECAPSNKETWKAAQQISTTMAYYGAQDASRKRGFPSLSPGPWAGIVVSTEGDGVFVSVSLKKWKKTQDILKEIHGFLDSGSIPYKLLESRCGYMVYVAQAFPAMRPFLVGLYGSLNSWRPDRTPDGFKIPNNSKRRKLNPVSEGWEKRDFEDEDLWKMNRLDREDLPNSDIHRFGSISPPESVKFTTRARSDVEFLMKLTLGEVPLRRRVRGNKMVSLVYGFGDASGRGFGSAIQLESGEVFYRTGLWSHTIIEEMSSNYKELRNLVESIEKAFSLGLLKGSQLMMFTDNSTAESAFHKGASSNPALHELVQRLRLLEMKAGAELFVVHVSGKRMIESGVDGLSRGDLNAGIMSGQSIHSLIPLHLSACERSPGLIPWTKSWAGEELEVLSPNDWPRIHKEKGTYLWTPPPAAADAALDWMGESIHKRSSSVHIVLIPRLMTFRWRKFLGKMTDLMLVMPCGTPHWPATTLEPLILAVSLPLSNRCNENGSWRFKDSRRVSVVESSVPKMWESNFGLVGHTLCKLLGDARRAREL